MADEKEQGLKFDDKKPMMYLLPSEALLGVASVFTYGVNKYGSHNWRKGIKFSRLLSSLLRHTFAFIAGEDIDESGLPHVDHMTANCLMLAQMYREKPELDDRYLNPPEFKVRKAVVQESPHDLCDNSAQGTTRFVNGTPLTVSTRGTYTVEAGIKGGK